MATARKGASDAGPKARGEQAGRYLAGRHALVTGGGRGIGAAIARELAGLGASVSLLGRNMERAAAHARALRQELGAEAAEVRCDVADEQSIETAVAAARERFGDPYVLVNNAGQGESAPFVSTTRDMWDRLLAVNLTAHFLFARQVLPAMLAAKEGRIVNIASTAALKGYSRLAAYCVSKHGVLGLTRSLALETVKHGITVNAVCPGYTDTDMAQQAVDNLVAARGTSAEEARRMVTGVIPRGTLITPEEVANAVAWLCSPAATAITGQAIVVAAGEVM